MRNYHLPPFLPPAIPDGDISCREQRFYEIRDAQAQEVLDRQIVQRFRRSSRITLKGQVTLDG